MSFDILTADDVINNEYYFSQILSSIVDPLLQMCSVSASRLNSIDMAAYMLNCIYLMQTTLALYEFTDTRLEMLQAQVSLSRRIRLFAVYFDILMCPFTAQEDWY